MIQEAQNLQALQALEMVRIGLAMGIEQSSSRLTEMEAETETDQNLESVIADNVAVAVQRLEELGTGNNPLVHRLLDPNRLSEQVAQIVSQAELAEEAPDYGLEPSTIVQDDFPMFNRVVAALLFEIPLEEVRDSYLPLSWPAEASAPTLVAHGNESTDIQTASFLLFTNLMEFASDHAPSLLTIHTIPDRSFASSLQGLVIPRSEARTNSDGVAYYEEDAPL